MTTLLNVQSGFRVNGYVLSSKKIMYGYPGSGHLCGLNTPCMARYMLTLTNHEEVSAGGAPDPLLIPRTEWGLTSPGHDKHLTFK